jgi:hypothetical protein
MNEATMDLVRQAAGGFLSYCEEGDFKMSEAEVERLVYLLAQKAAQIANENVGLFTPGCGDAILEFFVGGEKT